MLGVDDVESVKEASIDPTTHQESKHLMYVYWVARAVGVLRAELTAVNGMRHPSGRYATLVSGCCLRCAAVHP